MQQHNTIIDDKAALENAYTKIMCRMIPFVFICYLLCYFARVNVGFAKLQMLDALNMTETIYGLAAGIFFVGYVLCGVPSNLILSKVGTRKWISFLMVSWGICSTCLMFVETAGQFYTLRFFTGVFEAGFFPGVVLYFTRWFPGERRGRVMALFMAAIPLSGVTGGPLSGWILQSFSDGQGGLQGWQWLYLLQGIPTILMGVAVLFYLHDSVREAKWLSEREQELIAHELAQDEQRKQANSDASENHALSSFLRSPAVWLMCVIYFCIEMSEYSVSFWMPSIIKASGFENPQVIGWLSAIPYLAAGIVMIFVGRSADKHHERRWHLVVPMLVGIVGLIVAATFSNNPYIAMLGLTLATIGALTSLPMFWPLPGALLGTAAAAGGLALINTIGNMAGFFGNYMVGWVKDATQSTDLALYVIAAFVFVGVLLILRVPARLVNH